MRWLFLPLALIGCKGGVDCTPWYPDLDGDGFGDAANVGKFCEPQAGWVTQAGDCDDDDPESYPGAKELCDDVDNDCDGLSDADDDDTYGAQKGYVDKDGDGYGSGKEGRHCLAVPNGSDCDDGDPDINPANEEILRDGNDQDCNGIDDIGVLQSFEIIGGPTPTGDSGMQRQYTHSEPTAMVMSGGGGSFVMPSVNTSKCSNVSWSMWVKRGPDRPDRNHFLHVQWQVANGAPTTVFSLEGGSQDSDFKRYTGFIDDPGALAPGFELVLHRVGGRTGQNDFYVDDVFVGCLGDDADGDGRPEDQDCDDTDANHWSDCGTCTDTDGDGFGTGCNLGDDCDDTSATINALAIDTPGDSIDSNCDGGDGPMILDDAELGVPDPDVWNRATATAVTDPAQGTYALQFAGSQTLNSRTINTTNCSTVEWSYLGRRGPTPPDSNDELILSWWDGTAWVEADRWSGDGIDDPDYWNRYGSFPTGASSADFRVRLSSSGANNDVWFVDNFFAGCGVDTDADGTVNELDCAINDDEHWSDCGVCVDTDTDGYGAGCDLGDDCDDTYASINPLAAEIPDDGADQNCDGLDAVGVFDDFELGSLDPNTWSSGTAVVSAGAADSGAYSLEFAGTVEATVQVDTSACTDLAWGYLGKRGPQPPDTGDYLALDYWDGTAWVSVDQWEGEGVTDSGFSVRSGFIAASSAFHAGFELRLSSTQLNTERFYVDDFYVACSGDLDSDGVIDGFDCADSDAYHWSDCGLCADVDGDQYGTDCDLGDDCDETDVTINPGAVEVAGDNIDSNCDTLDGIGIIDDFEAGTVNPALWEPVTGDGGVVTNQVWAGTYALNLGGGRGEVESKPLNTTSCPSLYWVYQGKRGPEAPDSGDWLRLSWWDGTTWVVSDEWRGNSRSDPWEERTGVITDAAALHAGFKIQFSSRGSGRGTDDFFIDDFLLGCATDIDGDGVATAQDCDDNDSAHWSDCTTCVDADGDDFGTLCDLGDDCDDANIAINPLATDAAADGTDHDCNGIDGPPIFFDGFETGLFETTLWATAAGDAFPDSDYSWSGFWSGNVGGLTGQLISTTFDTTSCTTIAWHAQIKRGPDEPESTDSLAIDYDVGMGWNALDTVAGGATDLTFLPYGGTITDSAAFATTFRVRVRSLGNQDGTDDFYIDDLSVGCAP